MISRAFLNRSYKPSFSNAFAIISSLTSACRFNRTISASNARQRAQSSPAESGGGCWASAESTRNATFASLISGDHRPPVCVLSPRRSGTDHYGTILHGSQARCHGPSFALSRGKFGAWRCSAFCPPARFTFITRIKIAGRGVCAFQELLQPPSISILEKTGAGSFEHPKDLFRCGRSRRSSLLDLDHCIIIWAPTHLDQSCPIRGPRLSKSPARVRLGAEAVPS